jgi:hypothetical protein
MRRKIDLSAVLVANSTYARHALRWRLIEEHVLDYKWATCGNPGKWHGKDLSLHLDHVNGVFNDNRIGNLRFLCPNCHAQTDTYAGKNITGKIKQDIPRVNSRHEKLKKDRIIWGEIQKQIDFSKRGWVNQVAALLQISPQKVNKWILRVDYTFQHQL